MEHVVIIQSNLNFLELLLYRMPKEGREDVKYHFVVDDRWDSSLPEKLEKRLENFDMTCQVYRGSEIIDDCSRLLSLPRDSEPFLQEYRVVLKILAPLYFSHLVKYMIMDDDVVILKDPKPFIRNHHTTIQNIGFCRYKKPDEYFEQFNQIFNSSVTVKEWNQMNANGIVVVESESWIDWKDILYKTFTNAYLLELFNKRKATQFTKRTSKLFFVDLHLYCFKAILLKADRVGKGEVETWMTKKLPLIKSLLKKKVWPIFIHYSAGKHKQNYVELLMSKELPDELFKTKEPIL